MLLTQANEMESWVQLLTVFVLFIFILGITYVTTRFIGKLQRGTVNGRNLESLEALRISGNKYVQIIRAGNKYLLISVNKDGITLLTEIEETALIKSQEAPKTLNFKEILDKAKNLKQKE